MRAAFLDVVNRKNVRGTVVKEHTAPLSYPLHVFYEDRFWLELKETGCEITHFLGSRFQLVNIGFR